MNTPYKGTFKVTQQYQGTAHDGLDLVGIDDKNIYSTVRGKVERAGWENPVLRGQGFGLYVRIRTAENDTYYFGHLSSINVKVGQMVDKGTMIGVEGSTGKSTGSHCHYCVRFNADKRYIKDISAISGIPNAIGTYKMDNRKMGKVVCDSLSVRPQASTNGKLTTIYKGYDFEVLEVLNGWYKINWNNTIGYIMRFNPKKPSEIYAQEI